MSKKGDANSRASLIDFAVSSFRTEPTPKPVLWVLLLVQHYTEFSVCTLLYITMSILFSTLLIVWCMIANKMSYLLYKVVVKLKSSLNSKLIG